jgi:hypothetical protein
LWADVAELAASPDGLDPTEGFLNPFSDPLRYDMTLVSGGSPVDRRSPVRVVLRDMGREPQASDVGNEVFGVVVLVAGNMSVAGPVSGVVST